MKKKKSLSVWISQQASIKQYFADSSNINCLKSGYHCAIVHFVQLLDENAQLIRVRFHLWQLVWILVIIIIPPPPATGIGWEHEHQGKINRMYPVSVSLALCGLCCVADLISKGEIMHVRSMGIKVWWERLSLVCGSVPTAVWEHFLFILWGRISYTLGTSRHSTETWSSLQVWLTRLWIFSQFFQ